MSELDKYISKHAIWKMRLKTAIDTGESEWSPESVCRNDLCDFGKWLQSMQDTEKASEEWKKVRTLHAEFHSVAAKVLQLALDGHKEEAEATLTSNGSAFRVASANLTNAMVEWKNKLV